MLKSSLIVIAQTEEKWALSRIPNDELHTEKIVYETYFGEMEISDEEKKERLELAKELEPIFISFFLCFLGIW